MFRRTLAPLIWKYRTHVTNSFFFGKPKPLLAFGTPLTSSIFSRKADHLLGGYCRFGTTTPLMKNRPGPPDSPNRWREKSKHKKEKEKEKEKEEEKEKEKEKEEKEKEKEKEEIGPNGERYWCTICFPRRYFNTAADVRRHYEQLPKKKKSKNPGMKPRHHNHVFFCSVCGNGEKTSSKLEYAHKCTQKSN